MANKERGEVELRVGSKVFTLRLGTNEVAAVTPHLGGKSIFEIDLQDLAFFRAILFAMVKGQNGIRTIEEAGNLIDEDPLECSKAVYEAAALFFPKWIQNHQAAEPAKA